MTLRLDSFFSEALAEADRTHRRRRLRIMPSGDAMPLLNFSSNDYLGLARHPLLAARGAEWARQYGSGAGASRLVCGNLDIHEQVERKIALLKGTQAALLFSSGWQANATVIPALMAAVAGQGKPLVFCDRLNHASLHHGCAAAGVRQIRFRHNDLAHLDSLLRANADTPGARFILTESVFSMDGDRADVAALSALALRHDATLYLDEAHATGVLGEQGCGLSGQMAPGTGIIMGTFSKALGSFGAYIAGSRQLCDYLMNASSGFIYTTALPPSVLGAMDAALDLVADMDAERGHVARLADRLRAALGAMGIATGESSTQIVPALIGDEATTLAVSAALAQAGFLVTAIRPPTVPTGTSRLRIALSAAHTDADLDRLIAALQHAL